MRVAPLRPPVAAHGVRRQLEVVGHADLHARRVDLPDGRSGRKRFYYYIDNGSDILGIAHAVSGATAGTGAQLDSASVDALQFILNSQQLFPDGPLPRELFDFHDVYENDIPLPVGVVMYDRDVLGKSDWIYTDSLTEIASQLYIDAGYTPGANPRIYTSTRRLLDLNPAAHLLAAG